MKNRLFIQLGRVGDILNVLPLCKHWRDTTGLCPWLMVADKFLQVLDGVTYVQPLLFSGDFENMVGAWPLAETVANEEQMQSEIVCTQIYGDAIAANHTASSFVRQSWDQVPGAPPWGTLPLVFDRRDASREVGVKSFLTQRTAGKPYVVLALSGNSSPFPHAAELQRYLRAKLGKDFAIVDVSAFVAPRFYDLIHLIEGAHCVVTIDSGLLHLAHAAPDTPVVAFITREPSKWHGTAWRPNHAARFYYDEAPECFAEVVEQIASAGSRPVTLIHHASAFFGTPDEETQRRLTFAGKTWAAEYVTGRWIPVFVKEEGARTSKDIGDKFPVPFLRDVINADRKSVV